MTHEYLPPAPSLRIWEKGSVTVSSLYSTAGISTSMFMDTSEGRIVMEAGDGCIRDMIELERSRIREGRESGGNVELLGAVIISHPHYDHYAGLLNLLNFLHLMNRQEDLRIIYPGGGSAIEGIVRHFRETIWERCPFSIVMEPASGGDSFDTMGTSIRTIPVPHLNSRPGVVGGRVPAMAYSLEHDGVRVVYSGDTCGSEELTGMMEGADLGIVEATYSRTPEGHEDVHMDLKKAFDTVKKAKEHWIVHFTAASYAGYIEI